MYIDSSFGNIFDLNLPENFFIQGRTDRPAAIADDITGYADYIKEEHDFDVQSTISRWQANTNIPFNMVVPATLAEPRFLSWYFYGSFHTYVLIKEGVDVRALEKKLDRINSLPEWREPVSIILTPLKQLRYNIPSGNTASDIEFRHIQTFAIAGLLVILCSLFNHLTLFATRLRMKLRELALRKVNGATNWQNYAILYTDFLLIILLSLLLSFMLMTSLLPLFKEYADIEKDSVRIFTELLSYAILLIMCSIIACYILILYFHRQTFTGNFKVGSRNIFRKISLFIQLIISFGLIFCTTIFFKQIKFIHQTDLGINRRNIVAVQASCCPLNDPYYTERIRQIPGIKDALPILRNSFLENMISGSYPMSYEKEGETMTFNIFIIYAESHFFDFFEIKIIEGTIHPNEYNPGKGVFNETAIEEVGDVLRSREDVIGVARDFYFTPITKSVPTRISLPIDGHNSFRAIAYRYEDGMRQLTQQAVTQWLREEFTDQGEFEVRFDYMEDIFEDYFKSERALINLLTIMTLACILIAIFGVYSLTSLTCQQRRKEIAIRKVYGAEVIDILNIFFKEYLILLALAALVAFPAGFLIMKRWLEGYVKQTSMDAWLYVAIFLAVFVVIVFSIFSTVWRAANRNPAEVVKSE